MKPSRILQAFLLSAAALWATSACADGVHITAVNLKPNPPAMGANSLEFTVSDSGGQPVDGISVTSTVAMTTMDMGTVHPAVRAVGKGHYKVTVVFAMNGPWHVTLASTSAGGTFTRSFDFQPGSGKRWVMPGPVVANEPVSAKAVEPHPTRPVSLHEPVISNPGPGTDSARSQAQMPMTMPHEATGIPELKETGVTAAPAGMNLAQNAGFGNNAPMVAMMTLMMVGGSGMEGMRMQPMDLKFNAANYAGGGSNSGELDSAKPLKVVAKLAKPVTGGNNVVVTVSTPEGKPVLRAKIFATVTMASMDMGTAHPKVKELGKGKYALTANFGMAGRWRLTLAVSTPGTMPSTYAFTFEAK